MLSCTYIGLDRVSYANDRLAVVLSPESFVLFNKKGHGLYIAGIYMYTNPNAVNVCCNIIITNQVEKSRQTNISIFRL